MTLHLATTMTSLSSRDTRLKRQGHIISRARSCNNPSTSFEISRPLNIIVEEDESRSSSPSSYYSSSTADESLGVKARRRHATVSVSDLRISQVLPVLTNDEFVPPTSSPPTSPDSFKLTFTDVSFKFPHPPIPTPTCYQRHSECDSPTSSLSSSPGSQTEGMPLTPATSDDEFGPSSLVSQRPIIQPLVITKHNPRPSSPFEDTDYPISPSLLQPFKTPLEKLVQRPSTPLSPLSPSYLPEFFYDSDEASDSEPESDSEWYNKEFSKIISLRSPIPLQTSARPDSMSIDISTFGASKPLPPTPSTHLDPTLPRRRSSKRKYIPKYPPPPVPTITTTPSPTPSSSSSFNSLTRRPPPRSSIPADCIYDPEDVDVEDTSSLFSFSIYDVYLGDGSDEQPDSVPSTYSQCSYEDAMDGVTFDLEYPMMLPLSLPTTPFDLEADIAQGLEKLRSNIDVGPDAVTKPEPEQQQRRRQQPEIVVQPQPQPPQVFDDVFSPFSPTLIPHPDSPTTTPTHMEEKVLKSRWSTSTLNSIREEHETRGGASAKFRLYFSGHSPLKSKHPKPTKISSSSPSSSSPSHKAFPSCSPSPSPAVSCTNSSRSFNKSSRTRSRYSSDVMVIGYGGTATTGGGGGGIRRRGSVTNSVSDAGSEESCSSASSGGLRRKPIPVEMFLRSGGLTSP